MMTTWIVQEKRINIMDICKINTQIERLEQELAKLKEEATAPSQYELEYEAGNTNLIDNYRTIQGTSGTDEDYLNYGRYRKTLKFANEHFKTQNEMMRLGALIEAVTIEMNMEDWVADWNDDSQPKYYVDCDCKGNRYYPDCWWTLKTTGVIYVPKKVAERVCEILNNKEYELSGVNYEDRT
jgi:hypothetical protein